MIIIIIVLIVIIMIACRKSCNQFFMCFWRPGTFCHEGCLHLMRISKLLTEVNQCLHNKSSSHGVPNVNLFDFIFLLVDYGKVLCSSVNNLQQNSNARAKKEYCQPNRAPDKILMIYM